MMAKELILLSKSKYEELLKLASEQRQETPTRGINEKEEKNETPAVFRPTEQVSNSTETGKGMFVEKIDDDADGTPGIFDHSPKKIRKKMKRNVKWILY